MNRLRIPRCTSLSGRRDLQVSFQNDIAIFIPGAVSGMEMSVVMVTDTEVCKSR